MEQALWRPLAHSSMSQRAVASLAKVVTLAMCLNHVCYHALNLGFQINSLLKHTYLKGNAVGLPHTEYECFPHRP